MKLTKEIKTKRDRNDQLIDFTMYEMLSFYSF